MKPHAQLGFQILKRLAMTGGVIFVSAVGDWTDENFGLLQGLCIALLTLIVVQQLDKGDDSIHPKLLKQVCVLYCNRQIRKLFIANDNSPASLFADLLLALGLAAAAIVLYDDKTYNQANTAELKRIHESIIYLYGDIMDFLFQYGVLSVTICAFTFSMGLRTVKPSSHIQSFGLRLASMINANLLSEGLLTMVYTSSTELRILQCLASTCILRMILPDMQYYLTYLATQQLAMCLPDAAPIFFCITVCLDLLPKGSQEWASDICFTYVILALAKFTFQIPFWGMVLILVLSHYTDYIIRVNQS
jgi:hypothetical protein